MVYSLVESVKIGRRERENSFSKKTKKGEERKLCELVFVSGFFRASLGIGL